MVAFMTGLVLIALITAVTVVVINYINKTNESSWTYRNIIEKLDAIDAKLDGDKNRKG